MGLAASHFKTLLARVVVRRTLKVPLAFRSLGKGYHGLVKLYTGKVEE